MQRKLLSFTAICDADSAVEGTASGGCKAVGVSFVLVQPRRHRVLKVANNTEALKGEAIFMVLLSTG
jgi:hypothetical protein